MRLLRLVMMIILRMLITSMMRIMTDIPVLAESVTSTYADRRNGDMTAYGDGGGNGMTGLPLTRVIGKPLLMMLLLMGFRVAVVPRLVLLLYGVI